MSDGSLHRVTPILRDLTSLSARIRWGLHSLRVAQVGWYVSMVMFAFGMFADIRIMVLGAFGLISCPLIMLYTAEKVAELRMQYLEARKQRNVKTAQYWYEKTGSNILEFRITDP